FPQLKRQGERGRIAKVASQHEQTEPVRDVPGTGVLHWIKDRIDPLSTQIQCLSLRELPTSAALEKQLSAIEVQSSWSKSKLVKTVAKSSLATHATVLPQLDTALVKKRTRWLP